MDEYITQRQDVVGKLVGVELKSHLVVHGVFEYVLFVRFSYSTLKSLERVIE